MTELKKEIYKELERIQPAMWDNSYKAKHWFVLTHGLKGVRYNDKNYEIYDTYEHYTGKYHRLETKILLDALLKHLKTIESYNGLVQL